MMLNVPVPGGTTAHAVGGTLLAVLLGPWAACISISTALLIQALVFGDGGILSFGANCFNMAFVIPFFGYFVYRNREGPGPLQARRVHRPRDRVLCGDKSRRPLRRDRVRAPAPGGQGRHRSAPLLSLPSLGVDPGHDYPHLAVAGLVEAAFTVAIFAFVSKASPGAVYIGSPARTKPLYALIVALVLASPLGLLAAGSAWGERGPGEIKSVVSGGKSLGFVPAGMDRGFHFPAPIPDYGLKGFPGILGYALSALLGVAIFVIAYKLFGLLKKGKKDEARAGA